MSRVFFEGVEVGVGLGEIYPNQCLIRPEFCESRTWCPVQTIWREAQNVFAEVLCIKSLANIVSNSEFQQHWEKNHNY